MRIQTKLNILITIILILGFGTFGLYISWHESKLIHDKIRFESELLASTLVASIKNIMLSKAGPKGHERMLFDRAQLRNEMYARLQSLIKEVSQTEGKLIYIQPAINTPPHNLIKKVRRLARDGSGHLLKRVQLCDGLGALRIQSGSLSDKFVPIHLGKAIEQSEKISFHQDMANERLYTHLEPLLNEEQCQTCHGIGQNVLGVVSVSFSISEGMRDIKRNQIYLFFWSLSFTLITILILRIATKRVIIEPISKLVAAMQKIGSGNLEKRVDIKSRDEIGDIARVFNSMAKSLKESQEAQMQAQLQTLEFKAEFKAAAEIQLSLFPKVIPKIEGFDIAAMSQPRGNDVGGDYYDFIEEKDGSWGLLIADVSGKGLQASLSMARLSAGVHLEVEHHTPLTEMVFRLNNLLKKRMPLGKYITFFYASLDPKSKTLNYVNAGHEYPMLLHPDGRRKDLNVSGFFLGTFEPEMVNYESEEIKLQPGDILLLYTDGVTDTTNQAEETFGKDRLEALIKNNAHLSAEEIKEIIYNEVRSFEGEAPRFDDLTFVLIKVV